MAKKCGAPKTLQSLTNAHAHLAHASFHSRGEIPAVVSDEIEELYARMEKLLKVVSKFDGRVPIDITALSHP